MPPSPNAPQLSASVNNLLRTDSRSTFESANPPMPIHRRLDWPAAQERTRQLHRADTSFFAVRCCAAGSRGSERIPIGNP